MGVTQQADHILGRGCVARVSSRRQCRHRVLRRHSSKLVVRLPNTPAFRYCHRRIDPRGTEVGGRQQDICAHVGHLDAAFKGFLDNGIDLVDTRHEASAGHAAEAWARVTGDLSVCMITAGPGFTNAVTPMMNALHDGTPVLFMAGSPPLREEGLNILQGGVDQITMARPATKHAIRVTDPDRIPDMLAHAMTIARGGCPVRSLSSFRSIFLPGLRGCLRHCRCWLHPKARSQRRSISHVLSRRLRRPSGRSSFSVDRRPIRRCRSRYGILLTGQECPSSRPVARWG